MHVHNFSITISLRSSFNSILKKIKLKRRLWQLTILASYNLNNTSIFHSTNISCFKKELQKKEIGVTIYFFI